MSKLEPLKNKTIAIFGFGSQGKHQALLLRKKGLKVIIGARKNKSSWINALKEGFKVFSFKKASEKADLIIFLISDPVQKKVFESISNNLRNKIVCFASGFSIAFNLIKPLKETDIIMVTPVSPGYLLDSSDKKFGLIAVHQNYSGEALKIALSLTNALNLTPIKSSFKEEAIANLFSEQFFLVGGVIELGKIVFNELVKAKVSPKIAYLYTFNELYLLANLINNFGVEGTYNRISNTAEFGSRLNAPKIFGKEFKKNINSKLKEIKTGKFVLEWVKDFKSGEKKLKKLRSREKNSLIEKTFKKLKK